MKFKNAKMTKVPQKNPFPNTKVASTAEQVSLLLWRKITKDLDLKGKQAECKLKK